MGLMDQPDLGDDRWKCAKCGVVSGMYGHPNGCPPKDDSTCACSQCTAMPDDEKVVILRKALQELVDRRREVAARIGHRTGQSFEGSDGRYLRAQSALDATK